MVWEFTYELGVKDWVSGRTIAEACKVIMDATGMSYRELRLGTTIRKLTNEELDTKRVFEDEDDWFNENEKSITFREYINKWGVGDYVATTAY